MTEKRASIVGPLLFFTFTVACAAGSAFLIARHLLANTPVPAQVMVVYATDVVRGLDVRTEEGRKEAELRTAQMRTMVEEAVRRGIVVIDGDAVIQAPDEAIIGVR